jgi:hypothetical protein
MQRRDFLVPIVLSGSFHYRKRLSVCPCPSCSVNYCLIELIAGNDKKLPSFIRYMEKLKKPHTHCNMIISAVTKPAFTHILSIQLNIEVLPSQAAPTNHAFSSEQSMQEFNNHVKSYLLGVARQESNPGDISDAESKAGESAVEQFLAQIRQGATGASDAQIASLQLPSLQGIHCESALLRHHLEVLDPAPQSYFGVSKLSCVQCALYFEACGLLGAGSPLCDPWLS